MKKDYCYSYMPKCDDKYDDCCYGHKSKCDDKYDDGCDYKHKCDSCFCCDAKMMKKMRCMMGYMNKMSCKCMKMMDSMVCGMKY